MPSDACPAFPGAQAPERLPSASRLLALSVALVAVSATLGLVASEVDRPPPAVAAAGDGFMPAQSADALARLAAF